MKIFINILSLGVASIVFAAEPLEFDSTLRSVESKDWDQAKIMSEQSTDKNPKHAKSWYLRGVVAERLEDFENAEASYAKFLLLEPSGKRADAARRKHVDLAVKVDNRDKIRYSPKSIKFYFGYSPLWKPKISNEIGSTLTTSMDMGFEFGPFIIGGKMASGTLKGLMVPTPGVSKAALAIYTPVVSPATHKYLEGVIGAQFDLNAPYDGMLGPVVLSIPFLIGWAQNTVELSGTKYVNYGFDYHGGLKARYYTKTRFAADLSAIYHVGLPISGLRKNSSTAAVKNLNGELNKGSMDGFEIRLGIAFLFAESIPAEPL